MANFHCFYYTASMPDLDNNLLKAYRTSLERCQTNPHFLNHFYNKFVIANPAIRDKFANTDMNKQKMMLHASLYMISLMTQGNSAATAYLDNVAHRHSEAELNIPVEFYDLWLETLVSTVREMDPEFDQDVEHAWREVMHFAINYMLSNHLSHDDSDN